VRLSYFSCNPLIITFQPFVLVYVSLGIIRLLTQAINHNPRHYHGNAAAVAAADDGGDHAMTMTTT
jgi:hypothetical protein